MSKLTPAEIANSPSISLGGRTFFIPRLAIKQNRVVVRGLQVLLPVIAKLEIVSKTISDGGGAGAAMLADFPLDDKNFDTLCDVVYAAATRGDEALTRDEFDNLAMGIDELLIALPVIMAQSFAFTNRTQEGGPAATTGEAKPTSPGTSSLSDSAEPSAGPGTTSKAA